MADVLTVEDLIPAKKHDTFHSEVITGKAGGSAGGADIDYATNAVTGQVQATLPKVLRDVGFKPASFNFVTGGTLGLADADKAIRNPSPSGDNNWYSFGGNLPHVVAPGTDPTLPGSGYVPRTDVVLRNELAGVDGAGLSLSQIATNYGLDFANGDAWFTGEVITATDWRYFDNKVWVGNGASETCGAVPDYTNFHVIYPWHSQHEVALSGFGAVAGSDCTGAMTRAITHCKAFGYKALLLDVVGKVYISSVLPSLNNSFNCVILRSTVGKKCALDFAGNGVVGAGAISKAPDGALNWYGGSGGVFGVGVENVTINAERGGVYQGSPILVKGFGGLTFRNCDIFADSAVVLSNDIAAGTFTEFVYLDGCDIHCSRVFKMERGAGDWSFHGCGWGDSCAINVNGTEVVQVGSPGESGAGSQIVWYNAPVGGSIFPHGAGVTSFVTAHNPLSISSFTGNVRVENFGGGFVLSPSVAGSRSYYAGELLSVGGITSLGSCIPVEFFDLDSLGTPTFRIKPRKTLHTKPAGTDAVSLAFTGQQSDDGMGSLYMLTCTAPNYEYQQLWLVVGRISTGIAASATKIAEGRSFNATGFGAPTLRWLNNDTLQVQNSAWETTEISVKLFQLSASSYLGN